MQPRSRFKASILWHLNESLLNMADQTHQVVADDAMLEAGDEQDLDTDNSFAESAQFPDAKC